MFDQDFIKVMMALYQYYFFTPKIMNNIILSLFRNKYDADAAIDILLEKGISSKDMSIIIKKEKWSYYRDSIEKHGILEGTIAAGSFIGGMAGLLAGVGAITLPGIGAILVGGPLIALLGLSGGIAAAATTISGGITGAIAGGLLGSFIQLGMTEDDAKAYESGINDGLILLAIRTSGFQDELVKDILAEHFGTEIKTIAVVNTNGKNHAPHLVTH